MEPMVFFQNWISKEQIQVMRIQKGIVPFVAVMALAFAFSVTALRAEVAKKTAAQDAAAKTPCAKGTAKTVDAEHRGHPDCLKKGWDPAKCHGAKITTVAAKADGAKKGCNHGRGAEAKVAGSKSRCSKGKGALTAGKGGWHPGCNGKGYDPAKCRGAKITTVAAKAEGAKKGCGAKGAKAKTVATESAGAKKGCQGKGAQAKLAGSKSDWSKKCGQRGGLPAHAKAVLASLPKMTYRVGDFETCCSKSASAKAQETKSDIVFVIEGRAYENRGEAIEALVKQLSKQAADMGELKFVAGEQVFRCPVSAEAAAKDAKTTIKYRLAGFDFQDRKVAEKLADKVAESVGGIKMTCKSGGKTIACCKSAKKAGKSVTYVVGEEETPCDKTAQLMLAKQVIHTILETVAANAS